MCGIDAEPIEWADILLEYADLIATPKAKSIFELWIKIEYTEFKIHLIYMVCLQLKMGFDQELADIISALGYDVIEPLEEREKYLRQIYMVEAEAKTLFVLLNQYSNEYNILCPKDENLQKVNRRTEMDYEKELAILSRFYGSRINGNKRTVFEVCAIINAYIESNKVNHASRTTL